MKKVIHLIVCDNCGSEIDKEKLYVVSVKKGVKLIKKGDLCESCVEHVPAIFTLNAPRKYTRKAEHDGAGAIHQQV